MRARICWIKIFVEVIKTLKWKIHAAIHKYFVCLPFPPPYTSLRAQGNMNSRKKQQHPTINNASSSIKGIAKCSTLRSVAKVGSIHEPCQWHLCGVTTIKHTQNAFVFNGWLFRFIFTLLSRQHAAFAVPASHCGMHLSLLLLTNIARANIYHTVWECQFIEMGNREMTDCLPVNVCERVNAPSRGREKASERGHQETIRKINRNEQAQENAQAWREWKLQNCIELLTTFKWYLTAVGKKTATTTFIVLEWKQIKQLPNSYMNKNQGTASWYWKYELRWWCAARYKLAHTHTRTHKPPVNR